MVVEKNVGIPERSFDKHYIAIGMTDRWVETTSNRRISFGNRAMKFLKIYFIVCLVVIWAANASAGKIYTWTDAKGVTHITESPPPQGGKIDEVIEYTPKTKEEVDTIRERQQEFREQSQNSQTFRAAKTARKKADEARVRAEQAKAEADAAFQRSENFKAVVSNTVQRWQRNAATRKKLEAEAFEAQKKAQKAAEKADALEKRAKEAEKLAQEVLDRQEKAASTEDQKETVE